MGIPLKHGLKGWCHSLGVFAASLPPPNIRKSSSVYIIQHCIS